VCCSVLQCVAVCCSVLQCVAVCCSVLQCAAVWCCMLQSNSEVNTQKWPGQAIHISCPVCCSVLQCVAVCCSVLQCVAVCCSLTLKWIHRNGLGEPYFVSSCHCSSGMSLRDMTHSHVWHVSFICVTYHIWMRHVTFFVSIIAPLECTSCHVWMCHVTYEWVMSHMNDLCHISKSPATKDWCHAVIAPSVCHLCDMTHSHVWHGSCHMRMGYVTY